MAEENESSVTAPEAQQTALTRRARSNRAQKVEKAEKSGTPLMKRAADAVRTAPRKAAKRSAKPARTLATLAIVGGLIVTVGLPAYAATRTGDEAITLQDAAEAGAQSLVVASEADAPVIERESYSATTPEEIAKKKAEEEAAERARQRAAAAASSSSSSVSNINLNVVAPGSGAVRWPLGGYTLGDGFLSRGGAHHGVDMLTAGGSPIFAIADGVVRVSQESLGGYGVTVAIDHVINGQSVTSLYAHMIYGSRQVVPGQHVSAGQLIGLVGSTGRSTANHLHLEVRIGGGLVDPMGFLHANAG